MMTNQLFSFKETSNKDLGKPVDSKGNSLSGRVLITRDNQSLFFVAIIL